MANEQPRRLPWSDFLPLFYRQWNQGEHVGLIGPTGSGKSYLANQILNRRSHVAVFATKPADTSLDSLRRSGYRRIERWPPPPLAHRVLLWPRIREESDTWERQRPAFRDALGAIFRTGRWCLYLDELRYVTDKPLKLKSQVELLWLQGRSLKVSVVAATQRPAMVPLELYDQSTHLFFWRDNDENNLKRISGIGWRSARLIREAVASLPLHDVLHVNTRTGAMTITRAEKGN